MNYSFTLETPDSLTSSWSKLQHLRWDAVFILPYWLKVFLGEFGSGSEPYLFTLREDETVIGIAPLQLKGEKAYFTGKADVCDYLGFAVEPGREQEFFNLLLDNLKQQGIGFLDLCCLRPDSSATNLIAVAQNRGYQVSSKPEAVSLELDLPDSWEEYLGMLNAKQRHEIRRKLRRLEEEGEVDYCTISDAEAVLHLIDTFFKLFKESREDKAAFMTARMESFFRVMAKALAEVGLLKLGILKLNALPIAAVIYFDYQDTVYLYNSGYDPKFSSLSVGLLSKVLCIKDSIKMGKKKFDFMKGAEVYKYRLGGREVPISGCQIVIK